MKEKTREIEKLTRRPRDGDGERERVRVLQSFSVTSNIPRAHLHVLLINSTLLPFFLSLSFSSKRLFHSFSFHLFALLFLNPLSPLSFSLLLSTLNTPTTSLSPLKLESFLHAQWECFIDPPIGDRSFTTYSSRRHHPSETKREREKVREKGEREREKQGEKENKKKQGSNSQ